MRRHNKIHERKNDDKNIEMKRDSAGVNISLLAQKSGGIIFKNWHFGEEFLIRILKTDHFCKNYIIEIRIYKSSSIRGTNCSKTYEYLEFWGRFYNSNEIKGMLEIY